MVDYNELMSLAWKEKGGLILPAFTELTGDQEVKLEAYSTWNENAEEEFSFENIEKGLQVMKEFEEKREKIRQNLTEAFPDNPLMKITKPSIIYCSEEVKEVYEKLASYMKDVGYPPVTVVVISEEFLPEEGFLLVEKEKVDMYKPYNFEPFLPVYTKEESIALKFLGAYPREEIARLVLNSLNSITYFTFFVNKVEELRLLEQQNITKRVGRTLFCEQYTEQTEEKYNREQKKAVNRQKTSILEARRMLNEKRR